LNAQVLGISVDHIPCITAWAESLGGINYPLLSDFWPHGKVAEKFGVFRSDGKSERAIFVVDKEGAIQYIDIHDIDDQPSNDEVRRVLRKIDPGAAAAEPKKEETDPFPDGGIVLYCTPWCPDCRKTREWFSEKKLEYVEVDITKSRAAAERVMSWADGNRTTPTFDIDGTIIVDWDEDQLIETLKSKGYLE
jgi:glutaredoxin